MTFDAVELNRDLRKRGTQAGFDWLKWLVGAALAVFAYCMYLWEFGNVYSDMYIHASTAGAFNFADLHSITSRLAYPLWHLCVSALYQLGLPLGWAAALVSAAAKVAAYLLVRRYISVMLEGRVSRTVATLCALGLMLVTGVRIPGLNDGVYRPVGSPTVWHNPTQLAVLVTALLIVPYLAHCWYTFEAQLPAKGKHAMLPWRKVLVLAALLMLSLSCKPTFVQALIPAAAVFFLWQWIRHPGNSRYFLQIILAFLPATAYFLLQYLYYTGVVVPFTSGVSFGITLSAAWEAVRNMLVMALFPLYAIATTWRSGAGRDKAVVLVLLTALFAVLQAMFFRETGVRVNHGNFNWASMSAAFMLWVVAAPKYLAAIRDYRALRDARPAKGSQPDANGVAPQAAQAKALHLRSAGFLLGFLLLVWHLYSSVYYLVYLLTSGNMF